VFFVNPRGTICRGPHANGRRSSYAACGKLSQSSPISGIRALTPWTSGCTSEAALEATMLRNTRVGLSAVVLLVVFTAPTWAQSEAAAAAVKASPELVGTLSKEMGATPEQSAGAAGALFGLAKSRLGADQFSQIASAVPGMDALLGAAPAPAGALGGATGALSGLGGSASSLAGAANAFTKLGLKPDMVSKAVPVLTSFVTKSGGANVGNLLAGALK
jgi:hypothetical protein